MIEQKMRKVTLNMTITGLHAELLVPETIITERLRNNYQKDLEGNFEERFGQKCTIIAMEVVREREWGNE